MWWRIFWYIYPLVVLLATGFIVSRFLIFKKYSLKSVDLATILLVLGLHILSQDTYGQSFFPFWLIMTMLMGIAVAIFLGHYYGEIEYPRFFKLFWRLTFLMTIALYLVFIILNIIHHLN
ncbi:DUF3397 domain-containing protein [Enterococcus timonensis]|uniref:DUF3397 domain-containing protein n=1 Tax=Enterococcus timonensis TaxID=1852364 RepID=UPI0009F591C8|nr:DUF3397 domain-containing protein [Enterococcus timonensis]